MLSTTPDDEVAKNANRWHALVAEVNSAKAMMALAKLSRDYYAVRRNKENARQCYQMAMSLIQRISMSQEEEWYVWNLVAPVREWLESSGLLSLPGDQAGMPATAGPSQSDSARHLQH